MSDISFSNYSYISSTRASLVRSPHALIVVNLCITRYYIKRQTLDAPPLYLCFSLSLSPSLLHPSPLPRTVSVCLQHHLLRPKKRSHKLCKTEARTKRAEESEKKALTMQISLNREQQKYSSNKNNNNNKCNNNNKSKWPKAAADQVRSSV